MILEYGLDMIYFYKNISWSAGIIQLSFSLPWFWS